MGATVGDFWSWAYSDLLSSTDRAVFAEFVVGTACIPTERARIRLRACAPESS
jgi:hypothetical protein